MSEQNEALRDHQIDFVAAPAHVTLAASPEWRGYAACAALPCCRAGHGDDGDITCGRPATVLTPLGTGATSSADQARSAERRRSCALPGRPQVAAVAPVTARGVNGCIGLGPVACLPAVAAAFRPVAVIFRHCRAPWRHWGTAGSSTRSARLLPKIRHLSLVSPAIIS